MDKNSIDGDVVMTAGALDAAADRLEDAAKQVRRNAELIRKTGDLSNAAEAAAIISQVFGQCRLDLFVMRPIRALRDKMKTSASQ